VLANARNTRYFHNLQGPCDFAGVFASMGVSAAAIATAGAAAVPQWSPPPVAVGDVPTTLRLQTPHVHMSVPVARVDEIVGRGPMVKRVTAALTPGARVLLYGLPGVGKDTVMAEVAHRPEIQTLGGLQAWLQASSDVVLRRQLIELFATHRPRVVFGCENDAAAAIAAIKRWLLTNSDWVLFVEDASLASMTLWDVLPSGACTGGRVLVTSQEVGIAPAHPMFRQGSQFELEPISTDDSIELLMKSMVLFKKAPAPPDNEVEADLQQRCEVAGGAASYVAARYVPAPNGENSKERKLRRKTIEGKIFECMELNRPELRAFLEDALGNLPLSVALVEHMLRADARVRGVLDLIELFHKTADLAEMDRAGFNPMRDKHYYGLTLSVRITVDRLRSAEQVPEVDREGTLALLAIMSLLDRAQTLMSLLSGHDLLKATGLVCLICSDDGRNTHACASVECRQRRALSSMLSDGGMLGRAREVCHRYGLLRDSGEGSDGVVGVMHQLVQRCLRHDLVTTSEGGKVVVDTAREVLVTRFTYDTRTPPSQWPAMRRLVPCVQEWANHVCGDGAAVAATPEDGELLSSWGLLLNADGDGREAERVHEMASALLRQVLSAEHPKIVTSMNNLAAAYTAQGRHNDALRKNEEVLKFRRKVLPANHEHILASRNNLANTHSALGRHESALKIHEDVLKLRRQLLPPDHRDIALSMNNLASAYSALGRHEDALKMRVDTLEFDRRVLPSDQPDIALSMNNLASTYSALGWHKDALEKFEEALKFRRRVLPPDHAGIAQSINNLASAYLALGWHKDALEMFKEALTFRQRVLPPDHPDMQESMLNLASAYSALGWHKDALKMNEQALAFVRRVLPPDHPAIGTAMHNQATAYCYLGQHKDALEMFEAALQFRRQVLPPNHPDISESMGDLALIYSTSGRYADAFTMSTRALVKCWRALPRDHPDIALSIFNIGRMMSDVGEIIGAFRNMQCAVRMLERAGFRADHPRLVNFREHLEAVCRRIIASFTSLCANADRSSHS
jgi:tetratricopeptide (TPR) repeat protein